VISLSVQTPQHYQTIGLLTDYTDTYENSINTLLKFALQKVAFLPFAVLIDSWRWEVFSGQTQEADWNKRWWELRYRFTFINYKPACAIFKGEILIIIVLCFYFLFYRESLQMVSAPVERTEEHFDPGAKFHVPGNSQYIS
jgi:peptidyl-dipeptidase A